ncbi:MAG TPA: GNAT family N-acetyltransferase [Candidatus Dormibacteraeota bacterium]|nr:GNAT family N-acetyltransferase [Candidatus Dormibacteraeota bacterium]
MDDNLALHARHLHPWLTGALVHQPGDVVIADSGLHDDTFNVVAAARFTAENARRRIAETLALLDTGRPYSWWVGPSSTPADLGDLLVAAGLRPSEAEVAMYLDVERLRDTAAPAGLVVRLAGTRDELRDFAVIVADDPPVPTRMRFYERVAPAALAPGAAARYFVGYTGGAAVAAAELFYGAGVAGLYSVVTLASHRRRGFGAALSSAALRLAREDGYRVAVLQASGAGEPLYRRLGFEAIGEYREFAVG